MSVGLFFRGSRAELDAFSRSAGIMAELVVGRVPLVLLASKHGMTRPDLIRHLTGFLREGAAAIDRDISAAEFNPVPEDLGLDEPPPKVTRKRKKPQ